VRVINRVSRLRRLVDRLVDDRCRFYGFCSPHRFAFVPPVRAILLGVAVGLLGVAVGLLGVAVGLLGVAVGLLGGAAIRPTLWWIAVMAG
jgi:hypothetical protein